jgi:hypothetical protein
MADIVKTALSPTNRAHALQWDSLLVSSPQPRRDGEDVDVPRISENRLALLILGLDGRAAPAYAQKKGGGCFRPRTWTWRRT